MTHATQTLPPLVVDSFLPHRKPFCFVDHVVALNKKEGSFLADGSPKERAKVLEGAAVETLWNPTADWPIFAGHFPGAPIVPGVCLIESAAQAGCVLLVWTGALNLQTHLGYLVRTEGCAFKSPALPNTTLAVCSRIQKVVRQFVWIDFLIFDATQSAYGYDRTSSLLAPGFSGEQSSFDSLTKSPLVAEGTVVCGIAPRSAAA